MKLTTLKKQIIYACIILTGLAYSYAQPPSTKFGKVSDDYIKMTQYEADSNAEAVVLYDFGSARMVINNQGIRIVYEYHKRIKILSESMVGLADREIYFNAKEDNISKIEGITYNISQSGAIETEKLQKEHIHEEKLEGDYRKLSFSFPKVKAGSVIELSYRHTTEEIFFLSSWQFQQHDIPVLYSEYQTRIPDWFVFVPVMKGYLSLSERPEERYSETVAFSNVSRASNGYTVQHSVNRGTVPVEGRTISYIMKDIPPFITEPYLTNADDFLSTIDFQLSSIHFPGSTPQNFLSSWEKVSEELLAAESFGELIRKSNRVNDWIEEVNLAGSSDKEKAKAIYEYVRKRVKWDGRYRFMSDKRFKDLIEDGTGSSADINLFLIAMMRNAGLDCFPIILSTRSHGKMQDVYPVISQFNHVVALVNVDSTWLPLDATDRHVAFGMLPINDLNHRGFMIAEDRSQWVDIYPDFGFKRETSAMMKIDEANRLSGNLDVKISEYNAASLWEDLPQSDSVGQEFIHSYFLEDFTDISIKELKVKDQHADNHFSFSTQVETSDYLNVIGDYIYLQPMMYRAVKENPFQLEERKYPVDFAAPINWDYRLTLFIPEGMEIDVMPEPAKIVLPNQDGVFIYNYNQAAGTLMLMSKVQVNKVEFLPGEYAAIRDFFDFIVKKHAEQIVFKKKS